MKVHEMYLSNGRVVGGVRHRKEQHRCLFVTCLLLFFINTAYSAEPTKDEQLHDIDIPQLNAADALNRLAEQTGAVMLFPYELASARNANTVFGRYTLTEALKLLLQDSGLSSGLSDKRVIQISAIESETDTGEGQDMKVTKKGFGAFLASIFVASGASGQEADGGVGVRQLEEIVVTAERRENSLQDTAIAISAMTGQEMENWNIQSAEDLATFVPGLWIGSSVGNLSMSLRGVSNDSFFLAGDSPVAFNVDGVFRGRSTGGNATFFDIARVEVLKGPQGTLYGRNATAGAINVISNKPEQEFGGFIEAESGDYNLFGIRGVLNVPLSDTFAMRAAFYQRDRDGYFENGPQIKNSYSDMDQNSIRVKGLYTPNDKFSLLFTISEDERGGVGDGTQILPDPDAVMSDIVDPYKIYLNTEGRRDDSFKTYSTEMNYELDNTTLTYVGAYLDTSVDLTMDFDRNDVLANPLSVIVGSEQWSHEVRWASNENEKMDWLVGGFYFDEEALRATDIYITFGSGARLHSETVQPDFNVKSQAMFGQAAWHLKDTVDLVTGIRYTKDEKSEYGTFNRRQIDANPPTITTGDNKADWNSIDWLLGVNWYPVPETLVYGKISTGYKSGGFNNVLAVITDGKEFKPEEILAYQVGHKSQFNQDTVQINSELFYYDYTDLQVNQLIDNVNFVRNAATAVIWGVETDIIWLASYNLTANVGLSYLNATYFDFSQFSAVTRVVEDLDGATMARAPEFSGRIGLDYTFSMTGGWMVVPRVSFSWASDTKMTAFDDPGQLMKSWTRTDLSLDVVSPSGDWSAQFFLNNLEDDVVWSSGGVNGSGVRTLTARPPRMYGVRLRYGFGN